jgi:hypothetical protein
LSLDTTTKTLEVKLAGAVTTTQLPIVVSYVDVLNSDQSVSAISENDAVTNNGTAVTVVSAPASGHTRVVKFLSVRNSDSVNATVTVQVNNNGTTRILWSGVLTTGDTLQFIGA